MPTTRPATSAYRKVPTAPGTWSSRTTTSAAIRFPPTSESKLSHLLNPWQADDETAKQKAGYVSWLKARDAFGPVDGYVPDGSLSTDRSTPGEDYSSFTNCLDDAFATAAKTLAARIASHTLKDSAVVDWVRAQDSVFTNCGDGKVSRYFGPPDKAPAPPAPPRLPAAAPANAPQWLQQDRAYQLAAAGFYSLNYEDALKRFRAIAADTNSPWSLAARYLGFATYGGFRENWWCSTVPKLGQTLDADPDPPISAAGVTPPPDPKVKAPVPPPFLTPANLNEAHTEAAALERIPRASTYFAQEALAWQKLHSADPRTPDILGEADRVVRNACRKDPPYDEHGAPHLNPTDMTLTSNLARALFDTLQRNYPRRLPCRVPRFHYDGVVRTRFAPKPGKTIVVSLDAI